LIEVSIVFGRQLRSVGHSILCLLSAFFRRFLGIVTIFNLIIVQKSTVALKHQFECILVVLSWNDTGYTRVLFCLSQIHDNTTTYDNNAGRKQEATFKLATSIETDQYTFTCMHSIK
jgi:hypothetical protein